MTIDLGRAWRLAALGVVGGLACGGAAADAGGSWLSFSPLAAAAALLSGGLLLPGAGAARALGGLWIVLGLIVAGGFLCDFRPLSGPPLLALAAAGAVLGLAGARPGWASRAFVPAIVFVYLFASFRVQGRVGPQGDEPHYLMVAQSLLRDGDLAVERDYAEGRYRAFHPQPLGPHYLVRGSGGAIYSLHAVGLSILILPAFALGGYAGASFFMAILAAALAAQIRRLLRTVVDGPAAEATAWVVALSPPLLSYAGLVFTEVPAALLLCFALRAASPAARLSWPALIGAAAALAFLPWLHIRYALPALIVAMALLAARPGRRSFAAMASCGALSGIALVAYHQALYGFSNPARVFGRRPGFSVASFADGVPGLLLDQEFGLLVYAPVYILFPFGLAVLWRRRKAVIAVAAVALVLAAMLLAGAWPMWRGGFNPPARLLLPVIPALALGAAGALAGRWNAPRAVLVGWGLWIGLSGAWQPELVHRDREGSAPFFRAQSGAREWTSLLPRYVLREADRGVLAGIWGFALLTAGLWRGRGTGPKALAGTIAVFALAAAGASRAAQSASAGRDAVRLVGRPALRLGPEPSIAASAQGTWTPAEAGTPALHEPHRRPRLTLAERLPLDGGPYSLEILVEPLAQSAGGVYLRLDPGHPSSNCRGATVPLDSRGDRLTGGFTVNADCGPLSLALEGGNPLVVHRLTLSRFNPGPRPRV